MYVTLMPHMYAQARRPDGRRQAPKEGASRLEATPAALGIFGLPDKRAGPVANESRAGDRD